VIRAVVDTNLFIDWLEHRRRPELMAGRGFVRYLSAVVLMELRAGATTRASRRALDDLARAYGKAGRLLTPRAAVFDEAAQTQSLSPPSDPSVPVG
jgi:predicted nucleic acid-binding protein